MNHAGEIAPLARLARPHVAVVTTVEQAHIGHLGSLEAIADEKASICDGLEPGGIAGAARRFAAAGAAARARAGRGAGADLRQRGRTPMRACWQRRADAEGTDVTAAILGRELRFRLAAPGRHMAMNATAALLAAAALGADAGARRRGAGRVRAGRRPRRAPARARAAAARRCCWTKATTPPRASVRAALAVLALQPAARRIAVLGDMLELGDGGAGRTRRAGARCGALPPTCCSPAAR